MEYFDPAILPPPPTSRFQKDFELAGGIITLAFDISLGGDVNEAITSEASRLMKLYGPGGEKESTVCTPGGKPVVFSMTMCYGIARLMLASVPPEGAPDDWKLWDERQWALLVQRDREGFLKLLEALNEAEAKAEGPALGNDSGGAEDSS